MVKLLMYAYCTGTPSARKIEPATDEEIPYRVLAANHHPDHDRIAAFRQTHLAAAQRVDAAENAPYGQGHRRDDLPAELTRRESRLTKIREAKAALEAEAQAQAAAAKAKRAARETGRKPTGWPPRISDPTQATLQPKAQRHVTDPESRIMKDGATMSFVQASNAQVARNAAAQGIRDGGPGQGVR